MEKKRFFSAQNVATVGVLLALTIVLQLFASSIAIPALGVTLNLSLIPIVLGAIMLGVWVGAFLGFACGIVVLIQVIFNPVGNMFYTYIWTYDPVMTVITCIVKTTAAGLVAGLLFRLIEKKNRYVAVFVASGIVPIINTGLFILGALCMNQGVAHTQDWMVNTLGLGQFLGLNPFIFILLGLVTFNFFIEFAVNLLVSPALHTVYKVVEKRIKK